MDINRITIKAKPTIPDAPNGETIVDISFRIKDNISGYEMMNFASAIFIQRDMGGCICNPAIFKEYHQKPVGSAPGTWGLAEMTV